LIIFAFCVLSLRLIYLAVFPITYPHLRPRRVSLFFAFFHFSQRTFHVVISVVFLNSYRFGPACGLKKEKRERRRSGEERYKNTKAEERGKDGSELSITKREVRKKERLKAEEAIEKKRRGRRKIEEMGKGREPRTGRDKTVRDHKGWKKEAQITLCNIFNKFLGHFVLVSGCFC
jgi:hypothetical protein